MPETDLDLLIAAVKASGDIALDFFRADPKTWHKDDNAGPVTEADLAVNAYLEATLQAARPDYGWLSEETEDSAARLAVESQFVIDPIDGTRAFIEGSDSWAHSLAIVSNGVPVAAVVYLPARDLLYAAQIGCGATLNAAPLSVSDKTDFPGARILSNKPSFADHHWVDGAPPDGIERHFRSSLAYRLCLVAQGRFDAMMTLRATWEWDIAAGALIVAEAGGVATDWQGAALRFNNPHPQVDGVIAGGPLAEPLTQALRPNRP